MILPVLFCAFHWMPLAAGDAGAGDLHVLSIGVEPDLVAKGRNDPYARDAEHIAAALTAAKPFYKNVHSLVLAREQASKAAVVAALEKLVGTMTEHDVALIHFSTHGEILDDGDFAFTLAMKEGTEDEYDTLTGPEFHEQVAKMKGMVLVSLDTCHAAGILPDEAVACRASYLVASGLEESSYGSGPGRRRPHGYYIRAFVEGLGGQADADRDGRVTFGELVAYLPAKASQLCEDQNAESRVHQKHHAITLGTTRLAP